MEQRMAGDRGLACVVIGLIALSILSRADLRPRPNEQIASKEAQTTQQAAMTMGTHAARDLASRIVSDYRTYHDRLSGLAAVRESMPSAELVSLPLEAPIGAPGPSQDDAGDSSRALDASDLAIKPF